MTGYHRPVCVSCSREMIPEKNDVKLLDVSLVGGAYKVYCADKWICKSCGASIITGFGQDATYARHDGEPFEQSIKDARERGELYYCFESY